MILELLQNNVEVIDMHPIFMRNKKIFSTHLFAKGHHISCEGAVLVARAIAKYLQSTTNFEAKEEFENQWSANPNKATIYKNGQIYVANNSGKSPFGIFGNCNLQAYHEQGAGIASNLAFYLGNEVDYLGRKLIFCGKDGLSPKNEIFDGQTFEECRKRNIVICISFLSGSFVRTSITTNKHKLNYLFKALRGKERFHSAWSGLDLKRLVT